MDSNGNIPENKLTCRSIRRNPLGIPERGEFLKGAFPMSAFAVIVNLTPYVIAAIIAVFLAYKQKKTKCNINWYFTPLALAPVFLITFANILTKSLGKQENIITLCLLLLAYLISDIAFFIHLKPMEYGENFYIGLHLNFVSMGILFVRLIITRFWL